MLCFITSHRFDQNMVQYSLNSTQVSSDLSVLKTMSLKYKQRYDFNLDLEAVVVFFFVLTIS